MTEVRSSIVTLVAKAPIIVEGGVSLAAGRYSATKKQLGVALMKGKQWTPPTYMIELSADFLRNAGVKVNQWTISEEFDVTAQVRSGDFLEA